MDTAKTKNIPRSGHKTFLISKLRQINTEIEGGNFFEKIVKYFFKDIYQKKAQKIAVNKFDEINKIASQLRKKEN